MPDGWVLATGVTPTGGTRAPLAMPPDGRHIVFAARDTSGRQLLWLRSLGVAAPQMMPGTDDGASPFWAPDGHSVAFFARGKLLRIDLAGGPPITICAADDDRGGAWGTNDTIVFATSRSPLRKVRASGGAPAPVTQLRGDEIGHLRPAYLPDATTCCLHPAPVMAAEFCTCRL